MKTPTMYTKQTSLYVCIAMLCLLILARDIVGIGIPSLVFATMVAVAGFLLNLDKFKVFLFFLFPFTSGVPGYTMLVGIIALLCKSIGEKHIQKAQIFPVIFIAILELFNSIVNIGDLDLSGYASFISFTAIFFFFLFDKSNYKQSRKCLLAYIFGTTFVFIVIYFKMIDTYGVNAILSGMMRGNMGDIEMEGGGKLILNANSLAYLSIVLISSLLMGMKILKLSPIFYYPLLLLSILAGMGSFSRTWMLLFAFVIIIYIVNQRNFKALFSLIFVFGAIILLFPEIFSGFSNVMTERMTDETMSTGSNRTDIFQEYHQKWSNSLYYIILGVGVTSHEEVMNIHHAMHNSIQQIYVCLGLVGLFLFLVVFIKFFRIKIKGRILFVNYLPFLSSVLFLQSLQFLHPYYLMLPIIPACYAYFVREDN